MLVEVTIRFQTGAAEGEPELTSEQEDEIQDAIAGLVEVNVRDAIADGQFNADGALGELAELLILGVDAEQDP